MKKFVYFLVPLVVFVLLTGGQNHLTYDGLATALENLEDNNALEKALAEYQYMANVLEWYDTKQDQTTVGDVGALYLYDEDGTGHILISVDMFGAIPDTLYRMDWTHTGTENAEWYEAIGSGLKMVGQVIYGFGCMAGNLLIAPIAEAYTIVQSIMYLMGYIEI